MRYHVLAGVLATEIGLLAALHVDATADMWSRKSEHAQVRDLGAALGLTDLAIWTEARYTRHPSQADFFSAFQDFPGAIEHFPAGSIVGPPAHLRPTEWMASTPSQQAPRP